MTAENTDEWPEPLGAALSRLKDAVAAAVRERAELAARVREQEARCKALEAALNKSRAEAERRIGALMAEVSALRRRLSCAREEIDHLIADLDRDERESCREKP